MFMAPKRAPEPEYLSLVLNEDELDVVRLACTTLTSKGDELIDNAASYGIGPMMGAIERSNKVLLVKESIMFFKPGIEIMITREDLEIIKRSLEYYKKFVRDGLKAPLESALEKIRVLIEKA
jgi:hypothetical protein